MYFTYANSSKCPVSRALMKSSMWAMKGSWLKNRTLACGVSHSVPREELEPELEPKLDMVMVMELHCHWPFRTHSVLIIAIVTAMHSATPAKTIRNKDMESFAISHLASSGIKSRKLVIHVLSAEISGEQGMGRSR